MASVRSIDCTHWLYFAFHSLQLQLASASASDSKQSLRLTHSQCVNSTARRRVPPLNSSACTARSVIDRCIVSHRRARCCDPKPCNTSRRITRSSSRAVTDSFENKRRFASPNSTDQILRVSETRQTRSNSRIGVARDSPMQRLQTIDPTHRRVAATTHRDLIKQHCQCTAALVCTSECINTTQQSVVDSIWHQLLHSIDR